MAAALGPAMRRDTTTRRSRDEKTGLHVVSVSQAPSHCPVTQVSEGATANTSTT